MAVGYQAIVWAVPDLDTIERDTEATRGSGGNDRSKAPRAYALALEIRSDRGTERIRLVLAAVAQLWLDQGLDRRTDRHRETAILLAYDGETTVWRQDGDAAEFLVDLPVSPATRRRR